MDKGGYNMILNNNEIAAVKDCLTHKMILPKLEAIGGVEND